MVRETRHLWVGNLPDNIREDRIREHFKRYGRVQSVKLLAKGGGAEAGGAGVCAAVAFMDIKSAAKAHTAGHTLDERALTTDYYEPAAIPSSAGSSPAGSGYSASSGSVNSAHARHSVAGEESGAGAWRALEGEAGAGYARRAATPAYRDRIYRNGPAAYAQHQDRTSNPSVRSWYTGSGAAASAAPAEGSEGRRARRRSGSAASAGSNSSRSSSSSRTPSSPDSRTSSPATPARHHNSHQWSSSSNRAFAICVRNLPARSSDSSLKDGLYHEYKKHGKVAWVKVVGQNQDRYAVVRFKKPSDVEKALEVSQDKSFFGCKISVAPYQGCDADDSEAARPYEMDLDEYHPKATRTLFIGNLEKDVTPTMLRDKFKHFGRIIEIDIKKQSGGSAGYAFCQYASISSVVEAIRTMDGEYVGSSRVKLGFGKSMATTCVWIDGLADQTEKQVAAIVTRYGPISSLTVDRAAGAALAHYEQAAAAAQAVRDLRQRPTAPTTPRLMVDFASRECQEAFYETLEKQGGPAAPCLTSALSERLSSAERFSEGRTFEPGLATPQSRYTRYEGIRYDSSGSRSYTRSAPRTPRYTPLADHYDTANLDYSSDRRYRSYEDIGGSSSPTEEAVTSAAATSGVAGASGGYESEPRCLLQSVVVASPRRRPPRHHRHRSPHDSSPDDTKRFKDLHWAGSGRRSSGEVRHRSRSGERRRRGSDAERRRHRRRRDDSPGSRAGTPLCDELPDAPAPAEPRRPPAPPRDRLHQPMSLPLPKFAAQVLRSVPAQTPPPAPSTAPASPPRAPSASSSSGGSAPHSPSLEERIRSLDEKYEKWSGSRAAAAEAAERGRFRHRLLDLDINEVKPSDVVRSLLAKRSVFDEDSERLEGAAALERRAPSPSTTDGTRISAGGREAPRAAPRALQYPFPSHPPSAPSAEEVIKPATPPSAPNLTSDADSALRASPCVNDRVPSVGALVADNIHTTVPKSYPPRNTSGCLSIDSKLYKFSDVRKDSSNLGSLSDVEVVSKDTERSKLSVNSDNLDRRKCEVGDIVKVNRTDVDNLEVDLRDHNINSKLVNPDRNISDKKFSDVDKISKHEKPNTSLSQIDRKQEFHKLDTKYLHKIPLPLEKSHSDVTDKRKNEKQDKERTDHERENRRYDVDRKKLDTWNLFSNQVSGGKDNPDRDRERQETAQIDDRHRKYEHDKKSVDLDRERDKREKFEKENCDKDFSRSDKDHLIKEKERDRIEKERLEKEKVERDKAQKQRDKTERERMEKEKIERELAEKEKEKLEREKLEKAKLEKEKAEKERLERERERLEKLRIEREKLEKDRLERERERIQRERLDHEKLEREKIERERVEREKSERERVEREKAERERAEKERAERERAEKERAERECAERDRVEREQAEKDRVEREKAEKEKAERDKTEKENVEREKFEREKADKERAKDMEKISREKGEKDYMDKERGDKKLDEKSLRNEARRDRGDRKREEKDHTDCSDTSTIKDKRKDKDSSESKVETKHKYQSDKHRKDHSEGRKEARKESKEMSRKSSRDETPREIVRKDSSDSTASRASHDSSKSKEHDNLFESKDDSKHGGSRSKQSHETTHRHRHEKDFLSKISGKDGDTKRNDSDKVMTDKSKDKFQVSDEKVSDHKPKDKLGFDVQIQRHYSLDSQNVESKRKERLNSSSSLPSSIGSKRRMSSQDSIDSSIDESKKFRPSDCKIIERRDSKDSKHSEKSKHPKLSKIHYAKILEDKIKDEKKHVIKSNEESKHKIHDAKENENKQSSDKCKSVKRSPKVLPEEKMFSPSHELCKQEIPEIRNDIVSPQDIEFLATLELRSSEEDEKQKALRKEMKEKKRIQQLQQIQQLQMQQDAMQQSEMFNKLKDDKRMKNEDRKKDAIRDKRMSTERKSREDGPNKQNDIRKKTRKTLNSSDTSDSDEPKKHSIFDIVDDEPTYISMYDKVKARSCKNMQKQEEEKRQEKIKAKFSQFKQCRAKREEKKRSTSWDEDSDSDHERKKSSQKLLMASSSEDERGTRRHSRKDVTDSENDIEKCKLVDEKIIDYNDSTNDADKNKLCRKNSRSRIMSDTSDEENVKKTLQKIKKGPDFTQIKSDLFFDNEEEYMFSKNKDVKCNVKKEIDEKFSKSSLANLFNDNFISNFEEKKPIFSNNEVTSVLDVTIKTESGVKLECDLKPSVTKPTINDMSSEGESNNKIHSSVSDIRKKHKKKQKRSKCSLSEDENKLTDTNEKSPTIEGESKHRFSIEKSRRHSNKKEKRREKLRESFDGEDDKGKMKKNKKSSNIFDSKSESTNSSKREDKMEDIFGPLSDESDGGHKCNNSHANFNNKLFSPKTSTNDFEPMAASFDSKVLNEYSAKEKAREESRRRKERKRKEKKSVVREDENSLDVDAAGKAIEASLFADSMTENESQNVRIKAEPINHKLETDVFRFTDGDDSLESSLTTELKAVEKSRRELKEKKKKKKRSKEDRQSRREHHHHHHEKSDKSEKPIFVEKQIKQSPDLIVKTELDNSAKTVSECKPALPSPSLPRLTESPPLYKPVKTEVVSTTLKESSPIPAQLEIKEINESIKMEEVDVVETIKKEPTPPPGAIITEPDDDIKPASICKTSLSKPGEIRRLSEKFIPGFGGDIDETISENAVKSISEFESPSNERKDSITESTMLEDESDTNKMDEKSEEKPRAVISQEETEDAVAALLGESFGGNNSNFGGCYNEGSESPTDTGATVSPVNDNIPEEDAEEMRRAVQNLNASELEMKPDTPMSDTGLQIDTDTDEADEAQQEPTEKVSEHSSMPQVSTSVSYYDMKAGFGKPTSATAQSVIENQIYDPHKMTINNLRAPPVMNRGLELTNLSRDTSNIVSTANDSPYKSQMKIESLHQITSTATPVISTTWALGGANKPRDSQIVCSSNQMINRDDKTIHLATNILQLKPTSQSMGSNTQCRPMMTSHPRVPGPYQVRNQMLRPSNHIANLQPPTIKIPDQHLMYQKAQSSIVISPRMSSEVRMHSPKTSTHGDMTSPRMGNVTILNTASPNINSPPGLTSPNTLPQRSPGHVTVVRMQQPPLSPIQTVHLPNQHCNRSMLSPNRLNSVVVQNQTNPVHLNRIPVTPVLAPLSKPLHANNVLTQQTKPISAANTNLIQPPKLISTGDGRKNDQRTLQDSLIGNTKIILSPGMQQSQNPTVLAQNRLISMQNAIHNANLSSGMNIAPNKLIYNNSSQVPDKRDMQNLGYKGDMPKSDTINHLPFGQPPPIIHIATVNQNSGSVIQSGSKPLISIGQEAYSPGVRHPTNIIHQMNTQRTSTPAPMPTVMHIEQNKGQQTSVLSIGSMRPPGVLTRVETPITSTVAVTTSVLSNVVMTPLLVKSSQSNMKINSITEDSKFSNLKSVQAYAKSPYMPSVMTEYKNDDLLGKAKHDDFHNKDSDLREKKVVTLVSQVIPKLQMESPVQETDFEELLKDTTNEIKVERNEMKTEISVTAGKSISQYTATTVTNTYTENIRKEIPIKHYPNTPIETQPVKTVNENISLETSNKINHIDAKHDNWFPKGLNIESVIKNVDKLCSTDISQESSSNVQSPGPDNLNKVNESNSALSTDKPIDRPDTPKHLIQSPTMGNKQDIVEKVQDKSIIDNIINKSHENSATDKPVDIQVPVLKPSEDAQHIGSSPKEKELVLLEVKSEPSQKIEENIVTVKTAHDEQSTNVASANIVPTSIVSTNTGLESPQISKFAEQKEPDTELCNIETKSSTIPFKVKDVDHKSLSAADLVENVSESIEIRAKMTCSKRAGRMRGRKSDRQLDRVQTRQIAKPPRSTGTSRRGRGRGKVDKKIKTTPSGGFNMTGDIYDFHEDSGDETDSSPQNKNESRPRLILTIKSPLSGPANASANSTTATLPQKELLSEKITPVITSAANKDENKVEDFASPAVNTRKSRRLLEKDGNRNTVDDVIDDVVKNASSQNRILTKDGNTRRSTRQNGAKAGALEKSTTDLRKSPRGTKRRCTSETSIDSSDEKSSKKDLQDAATEPKLPKLTDLNVGPQRENPVISNIAVTTISATPLTTTSVASAVVTTVVSAPIPITKPPKKMISEISAKLASSAIATQLPEIIPVVLNKSIEVDISSREKNATDLSKAPVIHEKQRDNAMLLDKVPQAQVKDIPKSVELTRPENPEELILDPASGELLYMRRASDGTFQPVGGIAAASKLQSSTQIPVQMPTPSSTPGTSRTTPDVGTPVSKIDYMQVDSRPASTPTPMVVHAPIVSSVAVSTIQSPRMQYSAIVPGAYERKIYSPVIQAQNAPPVRLMAPNMGGKTVAISSSGLPGMVGIPGMGNNASQGIPTIPPGMPNIPGGIGNVASGTPSMPGNMASLRGAVSRGACAAPVRGALPRVRALAPPVAPAAAGASLPRGAQGHAPSPPHPKHIAIVGPQPIAGVNNSRAGLTSVPSVSPHSQIPLLSEVRSPPPAHQQTSPVTPGDGLYPHFSHQHYQVYQQHYRAQHESRATPSPYVVRSPLGAEGSEAPSPPLELRRPPSARVPRPAHSPSPCDRLPVGGCVARGSPPPAHGGARLPPALPPPGPPGPPHASQVPREADSLQMLLRRYPVMWQGLLALKNDAAAVQMHFVGGNPHVAAHTLPRHVDGSTPPLRIAQRMRLEPVQLEAVHRKMQLESEHCMLLALPCGRDHMDVLQQSTNLTSGFITYLQRKQAAGIVNVAPPGHHQAMYTVHIFPSCDFANENLDRIAPDLLHRVTDIAHLLIVIATV